MRLKENICINDLIEKVGECQSSVYYETHEGDVLNLSSTLSQFIFTTVAITPEYWIKGSVRCLNNSDYEILKDFLTGEEAV